MRMLIIGAGGIAHRHVDAIRRISAISVCGICDISRDRAESLAAKVAGAGVFTAAGEAIAHAKPDYVAILTPRGVREEPIGLCLAAKLPFFVEKPPCDRMSVGRRLEERISACGVIHTVGFMHRWHETLNAVMAELREERIVLITVRFVSPFATKPVYDKYPDPYLVERSGGLVGDQGIHYIDVCRFIAGAQVRKVNAAGYNHVLARSDKVTTCDTVCWTMEMSNGVVVNHSHTWVVPDGIVRSPWLATGARSPFRYLKTRREAFSGAKSMSTGGRTTNLNLSTGVFCGRSKRPIWAWSVRRTVTRWNHFAWHPK